MGRANNVASVGEKNGSNGDKVKREEDSNEKIKKVMEMTMAEEQYGVR